ncbi:hypothetical protein G4G28_14980 [Massilia sp. Dwa41.01b]|uniref:hypothetical protein n=1 Tax=unclassified Massilia TaxID=2609279 RepID=UPI0016004256|nr:MULTISPECIES: hypothetical protein [unclassified Massilia]QNA89452.1 hypothetical protein G4G28_14980 [Massilia sp. Dwa41.01b]QNB00354.1 hypothetical protein G4G31_18560 [Massilia sp. Se16.2.3]
MRRTLIKSLFAGLVSMLGAGCVEADEGPGMVLHFASLKEGVTVACRGGNLPGGNRFPGPGAIGRTKDWLNNGKTEGAAPDGRQLPEWVEFEWKEYVDEKEYSREELLALPVHVERIIIRDRVPQDVIDEATRSRREAAPGKLPDKTLWLNFVWTDGGIKFHWRLESPKVPGYVLRSGGDVIGTH